MKLTRIEVNGEKHLARVLENEVYDLNDTRTMEEVMTSEALAELENKEGNLVTDPYYVNLTSPKKIICVGLNYPKHTAGIRMKDPDYPLLFSKFQDTLIPHQADIEIYSYEDSYDYEGELVVVIGRDGFRISKKEAMDHIFGYAVGNDVTCREAQLRTSQWLTGKSMPTFGPCGPCIVTADSFTPRNKRIRSFVNGVLRQDGNTDEMIFKVEDIIEYASRYLPLSKGDLIYTGTPSGVALEQASGYLKDGDVIEIDIEGIGRLRNQVKMIR